MHRWTLIAVVFASPLVHAADEKPRGFDSPDAAFRAYVTGAVTGDFDLLLSALTRQSKAYHIGLAIFSATYLFRDDPAMQKILRGHGLEPSADTDEADSADEAGFVDAMLGIKEPGKLMKTIADRHLQLAKRLAKPKDARAHRNPPTREELLRLVSSVTLENVEITDHSAVASVKLPAPAKDRLTEIPDTIQFSFAGSRTVGTATLIRDDRRISETAKAGG
ncbi:MAG TPA: hypothetical protein EYP56_05905 [Planctomycetaceae bacterium]|nr:hypothetical protein [Planctomycetaceae bacterium]